MGKYSREMKKFVHTETCTQMFAAAPFIIVKRKKPQEPSKEEGLEGVGFVIRSEIPVLFVPFNQHPNTFL